MKFYLSIFILSAFIFFSCNNIINLDENPDPNNTEYEDLISNPTRAGINALAVGTVASMREELNIYYVNVGTIGREMYRFLAAEPRFTADLLGSGNSVLDNGGFYTTRPWQAFYRTVRNANILKFVVEGLNDEAVITTQEQNGVLGFSRTMIAYGYLQVYTLYYNMVREQHPTDFNEVGAIWNAEQALTNIANMLDEGYNELTNGSFSFTLPSGYALQSSWTNFKNAEGFSKFNRAIAARVRVYQQNYSEALTALNKSFLPSNLVNIDLKEGVYHVFTTNVNDAINPIYMDPVFSTSGDMWAVHPKWVMEADTNDTRVSQKVYMRDKVAELDTLSSQYALSIYDNQTAPMVIIRNAELVLLRAEVYVETSNFNEAVKNINVIRNQAGLSNYSGAMTKDALISEILHQRRYELFMENGHRWIDMRRFNKLDELPLDRQTDDVWESFPIPNNENVSN